MSARAPLFSVIIPTFNRVDLLRRTLASVFAQEFTDYEVIVVDDGSTDETWTTLTEEHGGRLVALRQDNAGPSAARNRGISHARGRYISTVDSDDLWFPWTLSAFARAIEAASGPSLLAGHLRPFRDERDLSTVRREEVTFEMFADYLASSRRGYFVGSCMAVYSRETLTRVGGFDASLVNMEDHDLCLRLGTAPGFVKITRPFTLGYRQHEGSIQSVERSTSGLLECLRRERAGSYPGGPRRAADRRRILSLHARPLSLACLRGGQPCLGWQIYAHTLAWNARERRARYLLGFPLRGLRANIGPRRR